MQHNDETHQRGGIFYHRNIRCIVLKLLLLEEWCALEQYRFIPRLLEENAYCVSLIDEI